MMTCFAILAFEGAREDASAQDFDGSTQNGNAATGSAPSGAPPPPLATSAVQTTNQPSQLNQQANPNSAVVNVFDTSAVSPTASTTGVSGTSGTVLPRFTYASTISRTVNANAFLPPDLITDNPILILPPTRNDGWWDISAGATTGINYDSNITRTSNDNAELGDFYEHTSAGVNFRVGTAATPIALQLAYNYSADLFDRYTSFDTYTHDLDFQGRIGRSNVILIPYFVGSFRSVEDPAARDAGRESYDYLSEGLRGQEQMAPDLIHTFDFSHTSVNYFQRTGADFQIWELYQELDLKPLVAENAKSPFIFSDAKVFPWLDIKQTTPSTGDDVNELNGGIGGSVNLAQQLSVQARVGWGDVESSSGSVRNGSFSGFRYNTEIDYSPLKILQLRLSYGRILSFTPTTIGRSVDILDFVIESPLAFGSHFVLTPAVEIYHTNSTDYQDPEHSTFPQPSLQLTYKINDNVGLFLRSQYRDTDDVRYGIQTDVKVLQTSIGLTARF